MVTSKEVEKFIEKNIGKDNFCFLSGYLKYSSSSRVQCAEIILDAYKRVEKNEIGKDLDTESKNNLKGALTIDMLSKVMMSIEDLGAVIIALDDLNNFTKNFLETGSGKARNVFDALIKKDSVFYYNLLTYPDVESLPIDSTDKELLERSYEKNIIVVKALFTKIIEFTKKHKRAFLKSKHGYPIFLGIEMADLANGINMVVPILYDSEPNHKSTIVLSGPIVMELYFKLITTISHLIKEIIYSKLQMIESAGSRQPLYRAYYQPSDIERKRIEEINKKCLFGETKPKVEINFVVQGEKTYMRELVEFFNTGWHIEG